MCELQDTIQEPVNPIVFQDFKCCVDIQHYTKNLVNWTDRIAIVLIDIETEEDVAIATINVPEEMLADNEVIIKDYSENEGMLSTLISAKIISVPVRFTIKGRFPICKLLLPCKKS